MLNPEELRFGQVLRTESLGIEVTQDGRTVPLSQDFDLGYNLALRAAPFELHFPEGNFALDVRGAIKDELDPNWKPDSLMLTALHERNLPYISAFVDSNKKNKIRVPDESGTIEFFNPFAAIADSRFSTSEIFTGDSACKRTSVEDTNRLGYHNFYSDRFGYSRIGYRTVFIASVIDECTNRQLIRNGETMYLLPCLRSLDDSGDATKLECDVLRVNF